MTAENPNSIEPSDGTKCVPLFRIERYLLNELSPEERSRFEAEIAGNPRWAAVVEEMRETKSSLSWSQVAARLPEPVSAPGPAAFFLRLKERLQAWVPAGQYPRMAGAGAFAMLLLLAPALFIELKKDPGLRSKGGSHPEIALQIGGAKVAPGQRRIVRSGDILGFSYRAEKPLFTQIWYQEDGGPLSVFDGRGDSSLFWPAASSWKVPPQRIRLEGDWKAQRILILASTVRLSSEEARMILHGKLRGPSGTQVLTYDLVQAP